MRLIKEFNWCKTYGIDSVVVDINNNVVTIHNSCKITKIKHMLEVFSWLKEHIEYNKIKLPSTWLQIHEWRTHNLLYDWNYEVNRTKTVDLNCDNKWYITVAYVLMSIFLYWKY